jgi:glycosyltransferase involved in cell wall biosynthesis
MGDVVWYCHIASLHRLGLSESKMPAGFTYGGPGVGLSPKLGAGDLCLVPIHGPKTHSEGYSRFSLPSKVTELFSSGVPVFSISGPTTAFARYLEETGTGVTVSPDSISGAAGVLSQLLDDSDKRDRMGQRARDYAQEHFEIDAFRERLLTRLRGIMVDRLSPIDRNLKPP